MTHTDATSESRGFKPAPKFFKVKGCEGDVSIEQVRRRLSRINIALNRADAQKNPYRHFEFSEDEVSDLAFFGLDRGRGSLQSTETEVDAPTIQTESTDDAADRVATQIDGTIVALSEACTSQIKTGEDLSAVRDEISVAPPCGPTPPLESTELADNPGNTPTSDSSELARQSQGLAAMALQDQHVGNSASADIIQAGPNNDVPACSTSGLDADDPGDAARQPPLDPIARPAFADPSPPKHSPPVQAVAVTAAKKVNRSLYAQPDFEHVQHEFDANGLSLKMLWDQYRQSHSNKRTYKYSQFCNRFNDWTTSHPSTALSQGP